MACCGVCSLIYPNYTQLLHQPFQRGTPEWSELTRHQQAHVQHAAMLVSLYQSWGSYKPVSSSISPPVNSLSIIILWDSTLVCIVYFLSRWLVSTQPCSHNLYVKTNYRGNKTFELLPMTNLLPVFAAPAKGQPCSDNTWKRPFGWPIQPFFSLVHATLGPILWGLFKKDENTATGYTEDDSCGCTCKVDHIQQSKPMLWWRKSDLLAID